MSSIERLAAVVPGGRVISRFGARRKGAHFGLDVHAAAGTSVYALLPGVVVVSVASGRMDRYGQTVVVHHPGGLYTLYAHLDSRAVALGAQVAAGALLGTVGTTSGTRADPGARFASAPPHLHLEVLTRWPPRRGARGLDRINPELLLAQMAAPAPILVAEDLPRPWPPRRPPLASRRVRRSGPSNSTGAPGLLLLAWLLTRQTA